jgi:hypothetical protein
MNYPEKRIMHPAYDICVTPRLYQWKVARRGRSAVPGLILSIVLFEILKVIIPEGREERISVLRTVPGSAFVSTSAG